MFHYYLQRGHALSTLLALNRQEQLFYMASMLLEIEGEARGG